MTDKPYDNNHFYDFPQSPQSIVILSLHEWKKLTRLPKENGIVYCIAQLIADRLEIGEAHHKSRGCIQDYLWDKTEIDIGMCSARICPDCLNTFDNRQTTQEEKNILTSLNLLLDNLSSASRSDQNIIKYLKSSKHEVFLCHNSADKEAVSKLKERLKVKGIRSWSDEQIKPGDEWMKVLEDKLSQIRAVAVCFGPHGVGRWQKAEINVCLARYRAERSNIQILPVILPNCPEDEDPEISDFIRVFQLVDLRIQESEFDRLVEGIRGVAQ